jgi:hypothetical protein
MSPAELIAKQNQDGGWPYHAGSSWTEPTVYALLAAAAAGASRAIVERGLAWLRSQQRRDGGWAPQPGVRESTWVTAAVALLPPEELGEAAHSGALAWLLRTNGQESSAVYIARQFLLGNRISGEQRLHGWPWYPGTSAWVAPTSLSILALQKASRRNHDPQLQSRIDLGRRFLLSRMCGQGGWNHGGVRALGYESTPYPETTGLALLALRGVRSPHLEKGLGVAGSFLATCHSAEGVSWLHLALLAHARLPAGCQLPAPPRRNVREAALWNLAAGAAAGQRNVFLE